MRRHHAHLSDEALVALVARGDEDALAELYDRIGRIAYGLALRVLRDERSPRTPCRRRSSGLADAPRPSGPERAKASTWVLTLVHRRAVDLVRREERRRVEPLGEEAGGAVAHGTHGGGRVAPVRARARPVGTDAAPGRRSARRSSSPTTEGSRSPSSRRGSACPLGTIKSRMFAGLARLRELLDEPTQEGSWKPEFTS